MIGNDYGDLVYWIVLLFGFLFEVGLICGILKLVFLNLNCWWYFGVWYKCGLFWICMFGLVVVVDCCILVGCFFRSCCWGVFFRICCFFIGGLIIVIFIGVFMVLGMGCCCCWLGFGWLLGFGIGWGYGFWFLILFCDFLSFIGRGLFDRDCCFGVLMFGIIDWGCFFIIVFFW